MAGSQFHDVSDVCTAMKQFSRQTSQSSAKGSFTTLDSLTTFSEAITRLCEEVVQLRAEVDDLKTQGRKQSAPERTSRDVSPAKSKPRKAAASKR